MGSPDPSWAHAAAWRRAIETIDLLAWLLAELRWKVEQLTVEWYEHYPKRTVTGQE